MTMTRQQLYDGIWTRTVMDFAEENGLNYSLLQRLLKKSDIPRPTRRDNTAIRQGGASLKDVHRPPLPGDPEEELRMPKRRERDDAVTERAPQDPEPVLPAATGSVRDQRDLEEILNAEEDPEQLPDAPVLIDFERHPRWRSLYFLKPAERRRVIRESERISIEPDGPLHPEVARIRKDLSVWQAQMEIVGEEQASRVVLEKPLYTDRVSMDCMDRVLRILNSLYQSLEALGETVLEQGIISIHGQPVELKFREARTREPHRPSVHDETVAGHVPRWDLRYNGTLTLSVGYLYSARDRKRERLEDRLGDLLELLYLTAFQLSESRPPEMKKSREQQRSYNRELERTEQLISQARDYEDAARIRQLIKGVQKKLPSGDLEHTENWASWAAWASEKAEWLDPTVGRKDLILGRRHDPILKLPDTES